MVYFLSYPLIRLKSLLKSDLFALKPRLSSVSFKSNILYQDEKQFEYLACQGQKQFFMLQKLYVKLITAKKLKRPTYAT